MACARSDAAHGPRWMVCDRVDTDRLGMEGIRPPIRSAMYLIPLFGHTRGYCRVAIQEGDGWVFQCADAAPVSHDFSVTPAWLNRIVLGSHGPRLRAFAREHPEVTMLAGHMWRSFFERQAAG